MGTTKELPTVISFCSGYGGIERGIELAGVEHRVIAYVEIEAFAIANLVAKMESGQLDPAPIWTDLKTFPAHLFRGAVDIITGGYPCQPFSAAGQRKGEDDPRHLWPTIREHVKTIRPDRCFFENVEGHISLGLSSVISDLEEDGFRATWGIFSAREVGAPHQRKRVFIMGNAEHDGSLATAQQRSIDTPSADNKKGQDKAIQSTRTSERRSGGDIQTSELADSSSARGQTWLPRQEHREERDTGKPNNSCNKQDGRKGCSQWSVEPRVGRVVDGCTDRVDRIRLLGNAVVPQTAAKAWETLGERNAKN